MPVGTADNVSSLVGRATVVDFTMALVLASIAWTTTLLAATGMNLVVDVGQTMDNVTVPDPPLRFDPPPLPQPGRAAKLANPASPNAVRPAVRKNSRRLVHLSPVLRHNPPLFVQFFMHLSLARPPEPSARAHARDRPNASRICLMRSGFVHR